MVCWLKYVVAKQKVVGWTPTSSIYVISTGVFSCNMGAWFWLGRAKTIGCTMDHGGPDSTSGGTVSAYVMWINCTAWSYVVL